MDKNVYRKIRILENVEHCGGKPEQADTVYIMSMMNDVTVSYMRIHLPFIGGIKRVFALH